MKQKQQGATAIFVVALDNGSELRFFGPNKQALQVETAEGIHNAQFSESADKGVFVWQEEGDRNRLSVKLDTQHNPNVSHDDTQPTSVGTALSTATGTAIGNLFTGGQSSTPTSVTTSVPRGPITPARQTNIALVSKPVPGLSDLVGARAGQAENVFTQRGYEFVWSQPDSSDNRMFAYWREPGTGLCVAVITQEGRYSNIVYANVTNQTTCR